MHTYPELSGRDQWHLLWWMHRHPQALLEDTLPWRYKHHHIRPAFCLGPRAWLCLHVLAGLLVALALGRR